MKRSLLSWMTDGADDGDGGGRWRKRAGERGSVGEKDEGERKEPGASVNNFEGVIILQ